MVHEKLGAAEPHREKVNLREREIENGHFDNAKIDVRAYGR